MSRWKIVRIEAGELDRLWHGDIDRSFSALGARLDLRVLYNGAAADRLLDEQHARLVGLVISLLQRYGWEVRVEVSFSEYGERGSVDVIGWHAAERALLVVEVKSELGAVEGTLRPMDVKVRLAPAVVARRFGWRPRTVSRMLVLPEDRTARRAVERHEAVLRAALPATSRELRRWLRDPGVAIAGIWFLSAGAGPGTAAGRNPSAVRRVRGPHRPAGRG